VSYAAAPGPCARRQCWVTCATRWRSMSSSAATLHGSDAESLPHRAWRRGASLRARVHRAGHRAAAFSRKRHVAVSTPSLKMKAPAFVVDVHNLTGTSFRRLPVASHVVACHRAQRQRRAGVRVRTHRQHRNDSGNDATRTLSGTSRTTRRSPRDEVQIYEPILVTGGLHNRPAQRTQYLKDNGCCRGASTRRQPRGDRGLW